MPDFTAEIFVATLAIVGAVIVVSALFSGAIERSGIPQVAVFLGIGAVLGTPGLHLFTAGIDSPILRVVATLSLALVLFTDAVSINVKEVRHNKLLSVLVLGPGTLLTAVLVALLSMWLLGLHPALAAVLGAALSSTDPVLLRSFLKRPELDGRTRQALRLESGMNDAVLVPIVLVGIALFTKGELTSQEWGKLLVDMLVLSPGIGAFVAFLGVGMLNYVRGRTGIRRDYESIYSIGIAFVAFAGGEAFHGSGFLAAFAAGLTISALDVELCDCFLEYGETTAEMALLFAFVLFGTQVVWSGLPLASPATMLFAGLVFLARPAAFIPALLPARIPWKSRLTIAWFGPRGLSSLLLVLLAAFAGLEGADGLIALCSLVVLCSIVVHGFSPALLFRKKVEAARHDLETVLPVPSAALAAAPSEEADRAGAPAGEYITVEEYRSLKAQGRKILAVDVRTERTYIDRDADAAEAIRIDPERAVADAKKKAVPADHILAAFCA